MTGKFGSDREAAARGDGREDEGDAGDADGADRDAGGAGGGAECENRGAAELNQATGGTARRAPETSRRALLPLPLTSHQLRSSFSHPPPPELRPGRVSHRILSIF